MLHIVNKSPAERNTLDSCLRVSAAGVGGALLLIEDGVYAAMRGHAFEPRLREAMGRMKVYVLQPDLDARGIGTAVIEGVESVDYGGFVDVVAQHKNCQSWL